MVRPLRTIGEHGIIGDLETAALVARDGAIDFMCWPSFDSPTIFADLLDNEKGGAFTIEPELDDPRLLQLYIPDTNLLLTRWIAEAGSAEVVDLMAYPATDKARGSKPQWLIRRLTATRGNVSFTVRCAPRFDYARETPDLAMIEGGICFSGHALALHLYASVPLVAEPGAATAHFTLTKGESCWFALGDRTFRRPDDSVIAAEIDETRSAWRGWLSQSTYEGRWRDQLHRSALVLKLLTSARHGSIAAAATFSLPEAIGHARNWDYRATWIRDASFTVYAFLRLGFVQEADHFCRWVGKRVMSCDGQNPLKIMYALDGSDIADEQCLPHLAGYADSRPVRIGNAAHEQRQLDIFGELLDSVYLANKYGSAISHDGWRHVRGLVDHVIANWREPDAGIWEVRSEPRHFLHSRVMCWVALDRAIRLAVKRSLPAPIPDWGKVRDEIVEDIWQNFRHPEHGYFVQTRGGTQVDAALLMMPLVRVVSAKDPVWLKTLDAIGAQLSDDGLVYRYRNEDGLDGEEGAFTTCTFWYSECLARAGRLDEARLTLEKGLSYANSLGLFAEELDRRGMQLGNFPQALTHLAFISAAHFLDRQLKHHREETWQP